MLRLRNTVIETLGGKRYYGGGLFSGIVFETNLGRVTDAFQVFQGVRQEEYRGEYVKAVPGALRLETECEGLEGDPEYELVTLKGAPFEGVLYEFEGDFCTGESAFVGGRRTIAVDWHRNGVTSSYDRFLKGVGSAFEWYEDGQLHRIYIVKEPGVSLAADLAEDGGLAVLEITDEFFATTRSFVEDLPFASIHEVGDLARYVVSRTLFLGKGGVGPDVFEVIARKDGLERVEVFKSFDTSLGDAELAQVGDLPSIRKIVVDDESGIHADMLRRIKRHRPTVEVVYNRTELQ